MNNNKATGDTTPDVIGTDTDIALLAVTEPYTAEAARHSMNETIGEIGTDAEAKGFNPFAVMLAMCNMNELAR